MSDEPKARAKSGAIWTAITAILVVAVVVSLAMLFSGNKPIGSEHLIGMDLPAFAAPLAIGPLDGDANVYTDEQAAQNKATAACDVKLPGAFNSCTELKGDSLIAFMNTRKDVCLKQIDTVNQVAAKNPDLSVVAVNFNQSKQTVASTVKERGWKIPVAVDDDGVVAALYSVAGCPSLYFAHDGKITRVKLGIQSPQQLQTLIDQNKATS
jgi:hypothetical protein